MFKKLKRYYIKRMLQGIFSAVSPTHSFKKTEQLLQKIEKVDIEAFDYLAIEFIKFVKKKKA